MFFLAVAAGFLNIYLLQEFILTDEVYHNTLGERLAYDRIEKMLDGQRAYAWIAYALIPLSVLLQVLAISVCLMTGVVLSLSKLKFKQVFRVTLTMVSIISVFRLIPVLVLLIQGVTVMDDLLTSDYYSLLALVDRDSVAPWLQIPLAAVNVFHVLLIAGLIAGLRYFSNNSTSWAAVVGYGGGTLLWWVGLMYVQFVFK
ncbi:hypothetical protein SAMN05444359_103178 [Neolewinella agarilytica]|uniref:Yip1 domain-containing protein n=2 Tax=Neolewinella agarilytica TaxID=478744 RepID=A0A1H9BLB3_9BACT|nr:hypothetical protein SAMN05444359_103178 [Neolewinella agarilytica]